jgi:hypothetical protein
MKDEKVSRKDFLKQLGMFGAVSVGASSILSACGGGGGDQEQSGNGGGGMQEKAATEDPCTDVSGLTDQEKQTRKQFQYVGESPNPEKLCSNCALYTKPEGDNPCGGCTLVKGPINPDGYCTAWAPMPQG